MSQLETITLENLRGMRPDDRINFLRGANPDYESMTAKVVDEVLAKSDEEEEARYVPARKEEVLAAFRQRVNSHLHCPGISEGGSALDHLPQIGRRLITDRQYHTLNAKAAGIAGQFIQNAGYSDFARGAFEQYGRLMAKQEFSKESKDK